MANTISLYAPPEEALRSTGFVRYIETAPISSKDIKEFEQQLNLFIETYKSAYMDYLKLTSMGVDNIGFNYLPIRRSSIGYPVSINLDNLIHCYGLPNFDGDASFLLTSMGLIIKQTNSNKEETSTDKKNHYASLLDELEIDIEFLDPTAKDINSQEKILSLFTTLNEVDSYGNKVIDGLIDCEDFNIRTRTLQIVNKLLLYTYRERKDDIELSKLSRDDDIAKDMAYQIYSLGNTNYEMGKAFFRKEPSQELIDYITNHAYNHYNGNRDVISLIESGRKEFFKLTFNKMIDQYKRGTLNTKKISYNIPDKINSAIDKYYKNLCNTLRNEGLDIEELEDSLYEEDISLTNMLKFKYYFENYKNDPKYNSIRQDFIEKYNLKQDFSVNEVISNYFIEISTDLVDGKRKEDELEKIIINGFRVYIENNYDKITDYLGLNKQLEGYRHELPQTQSSLDTYIQSRYLHGTDNYTDLLRVKRKLTTSIIKHEISKASHLEDAINELKQYHCDGYLDILNAILDTPECIEELKKRYIRGQAVFNMSRIIQKCNALKGLGDIIDIGSKIRIMGAIDDVYYWRTENNVARGQVEIDEASKHFVLFIPKSRPNEGTSIYLDLIYHNGKYELVPTHAFLDQRLELHNYGGKNRPGIVIHTNETTDYLPNSVGYTYAGVSSSPQSVQIKEMLDDDSRVSIVDDSHRIGGVH